MYALWICSNGKIATFYWRGDGTTGEGFRRWEQASWAEIQEDLPRRTVFEGFNEWKEKELPSFSPESTYPAEALIILDARMLVGYCQHFGISLGVEKHEGLHALTPNTREEISGGLSRHRLQHFPTRLPDLPGNEKPPSDLWIPVPLLETLNDFLAKEEDIRRVSNWPVERTFVYLDVSDFSKSPPKDEALIIASLVRAVSDDSLWPPWSNHEIPEMRKEIEAMLCIGDGYIFVFSKPLSGTFFAAYLAQLIEVMNAYGALPVEFHYRMGAHVGPVYTFWDPGRNGWNYIGEGINGGQRVLGAVGKETDDVLFISGDLRQRLTRDSVEGNACEKVLECLQNRGRRKDKHGNPWRVYELNHTNLCGGLVQRHVYPQRRFRQ